MEDKKSDGIMDCANKEEDEDILPGFRFHPTDEELVGFYLRRKVENKPFTIELIKHVNIYQFDPWDLPSSGVGDKEWYFFCQRERKYRNSTRPNRATSSGFWKAMGIDKPIYSTTGRHQCIGLKKSLVYYRGSVGKGTKTEWVMHEFRLPADHDNKITKHIDVKKITTNQEAEVWTLCRILKRNASTRKCIPDWRQLSSEKRNITAPINDKSITCSADLDATHEEGYKIGFGEPIVTKNKNNIDSHNETSQICSTQLNSSSQADSVATCSNFYYSDETRGWDELKSVVDHDVDLSIYEEIMHMCWY